MDVYVKEVSHEVGLGVFAGRDFQPGEPVLRATGKVVHNQTVFSIQVDWDRHLDPDAPAKFLNHSCDPNLAVRTIAGLPEFFALRAIHKNEQVCFDYAMTEYRHYPRSDPDEEFSLKCYCGSPKCRGRLGYFSELPEEIRKRYQGAFASYLVAGASSAPTGSAAGTVRARTGPLSLRPILPGSGQ